MLIKYIVYIAFGFKTIQVKWILEIVFRTPQIQTHTTPVRIYGESYRNKFCAVDFFFWNITYRPAISSVAKFHYVLGRGFMIQYNILSYNLCVVFETDYFKVV